jgi:hypothetical protein
LRSDRIRVGVDKELYLLHAGGINALASFVGEKWTTNFLWKARTLMIDSFTLYFFG